MSEPVKSAGPTVATNNTVKLPSALQQRVLTAMVVEGFTVWAEFCRVALTEKCRAIEDRLRARDPAEFQRRYGGSNGESAPRSKTNGESAARSKANGESPARGKK